MALAEFSQATTLLPEHVQRRFFLRQVKFPTPFLKGVAQVSDDIFGQDASEEYIDACIDQLADRVNLVYSAGKDFFYLDQNDEPIIPDVVWEIFGAGYDSLNPKDFPSDMDEGVQETLRQMWKIRRDPYPRQTETYASTDARFCFLLSANIALNELNDHLITSVTPAEESATIRSQFLTPLLTIDTEASGLDGWVGQAAKRAEFIFEYQDHPHLSVILNVTRDLYAREEGFTCADIINQFGIQDNDDEIAVTAFNFLREYMAAQYYIKPSESIYKSIYMALPPLKQFLEFHDSIDPELAAFCILFPIMQDEGVLEGIQEKFPDQSEKFELWLDVYENEKAWDDLEEEERAPLADALVARNITLLEHTDLELQQPRHKSNLSNADIIEIKANLIRFRDLLMAPIHPGQNLDMLDMARDLLASSFEKFSQLSEDRCIGHIPIAFQNNDEPSPNQ